MEVDSGRSAAVVPTMLNAVRYRYRPLVSLTRSILFTHTCTAVYRHCAVRREALPKSPMRSSLPMRIGARAVRRIRIEFESNSNSNRITWQVHCAADGNPCLDASPRRKGDDTGKQLSETSRTGTRCRRHRLPPARTGLSCRPSCGGTTALFTPDLA